MNFQPHGYADGGVYVLSRPAVEVFNRIMKNPALCPEHHRAEEDQEVNLQWALCEREFSNDS